MGELHGMWITSWIISIKLFPPKYQRISVSLFDYCLPPHLPTGSRRAGAESDFAPHFACSTYCRVLPVAGIQKVSVEWMVIQLGEELFFPCQPRNFSMSFVGKIYDTQQRTSALGLSMCDSARSCCRMRQPHPCANTWDFHTEAFVSCPVEYSSWLCE